MTRSPANISTAARSPARCPIAGCRSESAYADECSLGHQYSPNELIQPVSVTTGKTPSLKTVRNWYFDLERFAQALRDRQLELRSLENCRQSLVNVIEEFLKNPMIYVKNDDMEAVEELRTALPEHTLDADPHKTSAALVFTSLSDREQACRVLKEHGIRYRTGKTLVPFRLSGNVEWGIPVPEEEGINGLTFWVWPESLWGSGVLLQNHPQAARVPRRGLGPLVEGSRRGRLPVYRGGQYLFLRHRGNGAVYGSSRAGWAGGPAASPHHRAQSPRVLW